MKRVLLSTFFLVVVFNNAWAQRDFHLEISGGPSRSFLSYENSAFEPNFRSYTRLAWQGSLRGYYELGNDLEIGIQFDLVKRNHWRTFLYDTVSSFSFLGDNVFQMGFTMRKTYLKPNQTGFFWQLGPSLIFPPPAFNPTVTLDPIDGLETGLVRNTLGLGLNAEVGYKILNRRENYFSAGLRYQQGLFTYQQLNAAIFGSDGRPGVHQVKSNGSFASAFLGYGINTSNWSRYKKKIPKRYYNQNKLIKNELANEDGFYLLAYGGFRVKQPVTPTEDIYFNTSGQFSTVLGYKWGRMSFESGYGQFSAGNSISINYGPYQPFWTDWTVYGINTPFVPLTFKYDIPISEFKTVRFGPSFSAYLLLNDNTQQHQFISGTTNGAKIFEDGSRIDITLGKNTLPIEERKHIFFNTGMHLEFQVFNSSFMSLNLTRNFGSPVVSRLEVDYTIEQSNVQFEQEATLNGFRFDFGWKLPLNILDKQKKLALKR
jgi:hypothetical protein